MPGAGSNRVWILDAGAFYAGIEASAKPAYTTTKVMEEARRRGYWGEMGALRAKVADITVNDPSPQSVGRARREAEALGASMDLSEADISIIAMALELKDRGLEPTILTDDYSIQNVCKFLAISYNAITTSGIRQKVKWVWYCPGCSRTYKSASKPNCDVCGSLLARKRIKETQ